MSQQFGASTDLWEFVNPIWGAFPDVNLRVIWWESSSRRRRSGAEEVKTQQKEATSQEDLHLQDS